MILNFPMPIVTPRLILRPPELSDLDINGYYDCVTDSMDDLSKWLPWAKYYPTKSMVKDYIRDCEISWKLKNNNNIGLPLWIFKREDNSMVGSIVMWNIVWKIPKFEFGYWLRTAQTHNGYISEAANALTRYCFSELGVKRIEIKCEKEDVRAKKIPERLGYRMDGVLLNDACAVSTGDLTDVLLYSRIDANNLPDLDVSWEKENKKR